jgi:polyphenol oxidase
MFMTLPQPTGGFEWTQAPWGTVLRCRPLLDIADHFFTTADVALGPDDPEWKAVASGIGVERGRLLLIRQVHGATVAVARATRSPEWDRPEADVIVSDDRTSAIGVRVADCAPILLADARLGVVGAAHAGWRGTVHSSASVAVRAMADTFGSAPADLVAAIGPCLGRCCGEVGLEVVDAFRSGGHSEDALGRWFQPGQSGRSYLDLALANSDQLVSAGVPPSRIHVAGLCTKCSPSVFHSYRHAKGHAGRMLAAIRGITSSAAPPS